MAQLMPLPLTLSCSSKSTLVIWYVYLPGFTFLVPAHPGSPGQSLGGRKTVVVVVVEEMYILTYYIFASNVRNNWTMPYLEGCDYAVRSCIWQNEPVFLADDQNSHGRMPVRPCGITEASQFVERWLAFHGKCLSDAVPYGRAARAPARPPSSPLMFCRPLLPAAHLVGATLWGLLWYLASDELELEVGDTYLDLRIIATTQ